MKSGINKMKKLLGFLLALCMLVSVLGLSANAVGVELTEGNHEEWIDRVDFSGADYATQLYNWLVENSDGDGTDDALIDPTTAENVNGEYVYNLAVITGSVPFTYDTSASDVSSSAWAAINEAAPSIGDIEPYLNAAYDAFDRDHPEVFWLSGSRLYGGSTSYSYSYGGGSGTANYTRYFYFILQNSDFDIRMTDMYSNADSIRSAIAARDDAVDAIIDNMEAETDYEKVVYLNDWLTANNCYNSNLSTANKNAWECMSALTGYTGDNRNAPVCEGYARAFKVLCDKLGIPCVLVDGNAINSSGNAGAHMWNYVELDGAWYAVDVTWNDPTVSGVTEKVSGYERDDYLLVGSDTPVSGETSFSENHIPENTVSVGGTAFVNGPVLSNCAYTVALEKKVNVGCPSEDVKFEVERQVVTVTHSAPCRVGYLKDGEYVTIPAVSNEDGSYSFTAPSGVDEVLLVVIGDVDEDGDVDSDDVTLLAESLLPSSYAAYIELGAEQSFAADVNGNGELNSADRVLLARCLLEKTHSLYKSFEWEVE